jgi:hypothetical protein
MTTNTLVNPLPQVDNTDQRTGAPIGTYSDEEIRQAAVEAATTDTIFDPKSTPGDRVFKDMIAQSDPVHRGKRASILEVMGVHYDYMEKMSRANLVMSNVNSAEDTDYLEEAGVLYDEALKKRAELPLEYPDNGILHEVARATAEGVGTMKTMLTEAAPGVTKDVLSGAGVGALAGIAMAAPTGEIASPITVTGGMVLGAGVGFKVGVPARMYEASYNMGKGELMFQMLKPAEGKEPIPLAIAAPMAAKMAYAYAALETVGDIGVLISAVGVSATVAERITSIAGEGATEWAQTIVEQVTGHMARKKFAEVKGSEFTETLDDVLDYVEAKKAARQGILASGGMMTPSTLVKIPVETQRFLKDKKQAQVVASIEADNQYQVQQNNTIVKENSDKPLADITDEVTNTLVKGAPIAQAEVSRVRNDSIIKGTDVKDGDIDDLIIVADEDLDSAIDDLDNRLYNSLDDKAANFFVGLSDFLQDDEQFNAIEEIVGARAQAMGVTTTKYIEQKGLEFENLGVEDQERNSYVTFTEDNRIIISAFSNGDLSSVIHELGHVFRRDLQGDMAAIADEFVGMEKGSKWDVQAEEKFARGWENYMSTGKAPTQKLETLFGKLHSWLIGIYKAIRGSDIDVAIPPKMVKVYDSLLVRKEVASNNSVSYPQFKGLSDKEVYRNELTQSKEEGTKVAKSISADLDYIVDTAGKHYFKDKEGVSFFTTSLLPEDVQQAYQAAQTAPVIRTKEGLEAQGEQNDVLNQKRREEDTIEEEALRLKKQREAAQRALNSYYTDTAGKATKGLTESQVAREHAKALIKSMRQMFDAGDLHGYKIARDHMKAFLARERNRFATQRKHKAMRKSILKKLKRGQPSTASGKAQVRINPELATMLRKVYEVLGNANTDKKIRKLYDERLGEGFFLHDFVTNEVDYIINRFLDGAVSRNIFGLKTLSHLNDDIKALLAGETKNSPVMRVKAAIDQAKGDLIHEINGGNLVDSPIEDTNRLHKERQKQKSLKERIATGTIGEKYIFGLGGLVKIASSYSPLVDSKLSKITNFFQAKQNKSTEVRNEQNKMIAMYQEAFGINSSYKMYGKWKEDSQRVHDIGAGVLFSKSELRQIWMYAQDEKLTNRLVNMFTDLRSKVNDKMTDEEILAAVGDATRAYEDILANLENTLSNEDIAFAEMLKGYFNSGDQYNSVNEVYERVFGVPLNRVENYVPIRSKHYLDLNERLDNANKYTQFNHDDSIRKTPLSAKSIKERVKNAERYQLHFQGDLSLYSSYVEEMAHFKAFAEQGRLAKMVLDDKDIRRAIEIEYSPELYRNITSALDDVLADGIVTATQFPLMDRFRSAFVRSSIGASTSVFFKQQISGVQYWQHMPATAFMKGTLKFWTNPVKHVEEMFKTNYLQNRKNLIDRDLKQATASSDYSKFKLNPVLSNLLTLNVQIGDALAIAQGSWIMKEHLRTQVNPDTGKTYTTKEALQKAFELSEKTQQSGTMQELSAIQRGGSAAQLLTMYSTGPVQALRQEIEAVRDLAAGKITKKQFAKTIFIYHILVPSIFAAVGNAISGGNDGDKLKTQLIAVMLGPFGATYAVGTVVTEAFRRALGLRRYELDGTFADTVSDIEKIAEKFTKDKELDLDDYAAALQAVTVFTGHGIPVQRFTRTAQNVVEGDMAGAIFSQNPDAE